MQTSLQLRLGATGSPARIASGYEVYALGDSRINQLLQSSVSYAAIGGGPNWARAFTEGAFDMPIANINGGSGETSSTIRTTRFPTALASTAQILIYLGEINDPFNAIPIATTKDNLSYMFTTWVNSSPGRVVWALDEMPWDTALIVSTQPQRDHQVEARDYIRSLASAATGIYIVPAWQASTGGNDSFVPQAGWYYDALHPGTLGSHNLGAEIVTTGTGTYPPYDVYTRTPLVGGAAGQIGDFSGASLAAAGLGTSGTIASSSIQAIDGLNWATLTFNTNSGSVQLYGASSSVLPVGVAPGTTTMDALISCVIEAGSSNISSITLRQSKNSLVAFGGGDMLGSGSGTDIGSLPATESRFNLWTPPSVLPADATGYRWWVTIAPRYISSVAQTMAGTVRFAFPQVYGV